MKRDGDVSLMKAGNTHTLSRADAEDFLFKEALLLDSVRLEEWLTLFAPNSLYWIPIDPEDDIATHSALVYDTDIRREERVYHLVHNKFPAQSPRSRTVHFITNVVVSPVDDSENIDITSSQLIYEMRTGDYTQIGLGDVRPLVAQVTHTVRMIDGSPRIVCKKILLINRDTWHGNLTFII